MLGRHGRDALDKWPSDIEQLRDACCIDRDLDFHVLGGADFPLRLLGTLPSSWTVHPFDSIDVREFLWGLDFYAYFPQEDMFEAFGRAPMEAMAAGVPVILPPRFEEMFGSAALYCEPRAVWGIIEKLWADSRAYMTRVEAGLSYVRKVCDMPNFGRRVSEVIRLQRTIGR